jgi:hypothetical protein
MVDFFWVILFKLCRPETSCLKCSKFFQLVRPVLNEYVPHVLTICLPRDTYKAVFDFPLTKMVCSLVQFRIHTLTESEK